MLYDFSLGDFRPNLTLILDVSVQTGLDRLAARSGVADRYERMDRDFHERLRRGFLDIAAAEPDRCVIIDESNPYASISSEITFQIQELAFDFLDAPIKRITAKDVPAPYAKNLIEYYMPQEEDAYQACLSVMYAK